MTSSVVAAIAIGAMVSANDGTFGQDVLVGWPNRIEVVANTAWLLVVATHATRLAQQQTGSSRRAPSTTDRQVTLAA